MSYSDEHTALSLSEESALRFFLDFLFLCLVVLLGEESGELSGSFGKGHPLGGVVRGISMS